MSAYFSLCLKDISVENVSVMFELSEAFNATSLRHTCILFILENYEKLSLKSWYATLTILPIAPLCLSLS